ncbi:MAG: hypothetical protein GTO63_35330, partial [Anaerolineae bacterium]|nr:hypothetical protein [Anaerolineae bacterium]
MDRIPLYDPLPSPVPPTDLSKIHWMDMARQLEARAKEFFNLPSAV